MDWTGCFWKRDSGKVLALSAPVLMRARHRVCDPVVPRHTCLPSDEPPGNCENKEEHRPWTPPPPGLPPAESNTEDQQKRGAASPAPSWPPVQPGGQMETLFPPPDSQAAFPAFLPEPALAQAASTL